MTSSIPTSQRTVAAMFGRIASGYDVANSILSFGIDRLWRCRLVKGVEVAFAPGSRRRILDLAAGTYDVSLALVRTIPGATVLAADFCLPMLQAGKGKLGAAGAYAQRRITPLAGDGLGLPLKDACVDAVTVSFGLRNMRPRERALAEVYRVLVPGGFFHVLEFGSAKGRIWGGLYNLYLTRVLPFVGGFVTGDKDAYEYLARTITDFPEASLLTAELYHAGFREVVGHKFWGGIVYLHVGKK